MFGFNPSGEYPFGTIKKILGTYYSTQRSESQTINDNEDVQALFAGSVLEPQTINDNEDVQALFAGSVLEPQKLSDKESILASFVSSILEPQTIDDNEDIHAAFIGSVLEPQILIDSTKSKSANSGYGFGITVTSDVISNFDGLQTCDLIKEQATLSYHYGNSFTVPNCQPGIYCYQTIIKNYSSNRNVSLNAFISGGELRARVIFNPVTKEFLSPTYSYTDSIIDYGYMNLNNDFIMVYMIFNHTTANDNLLFRLQLHNSTNSTYLGNINYGLYVGGTEIKYSKSYDSYIYNNSNISQRDNETLYINYTLPLNDFTIYFEWTPTCFTNGSGGTIFQTKNTLLKGGISLDYVMQNNNMIVTLSKNTNLNTINAKSNTVVYIDPITYTPPLQINYSTKKVALRFSSNNSSSISGMDMFIDGIKCTGNTDNSTCIVDSKFTIGNDYTNTNADNSYHKNFQVFNKVLTDIKIVNLTSI